MKTGDQIEVHLSPFTQLSSLDVYHLLRLRQEVFVVEQNCPYLDADGLDLISEHLLAWAQIPGESQRKLVGCLRITPPGSRFAETSIGRIVTAQTHRGVGLGKDIVAKAMNELQSRGVEAIRISAQKYLEKFYGEFGFQCVSEPYLEDDIPHIEMLWRHS